MGLSNNIKIMTVTDPALDLLSGEITFEKMEAVMKELKKLKPVPELTFSSRERIEFFQKNSRPLRIPCNNIFFIDPQL